MKGSENEGGSSDIEGCSGGETGFDDRNSGDCYGSEDFELGSRTESFDS